MQGLHKTESLKTHPTGEQGWGVPPTVGLEAWSAWRPIPAIADWFRLSPFPIYWYRRRNNTGHPYSICMEPWKSIFCEKDFYDPTFDKKS